MGEQYAWISLNLTKQHMGEASNLEASCLTIPQELEPGSSSFVQNLLVPTKPRQRRSNFERGCVRSKPRLFPPPESEAPTKENELNLPEELDEVDGLDTGEGSVDPEDERSVGKVVMREAEKSIQLSSSEGNAGADDGADMVKEGCRAIHTRRKRDTLESV
jgi:hypothetical protein